ncbi:MAG: glutamate-1-semialdehyde 2,1-aminomutase [Parachlamydiaceae bacterium]|nr:glutamate-1-semialdehyde 2,1-aminomutase [Parachlamydiaceae bacterium]
MTSESLYHLQKSDQLQTSTQLQKKVAPLNRAKSQEIYKRLCEVIPGGVNSPVRAFKGLDMSPMVIEKALADTIYDVDGNVFIDYCGSWGPLIHGHAHPAILQAATQQMAKGTTFGITSAVEEMLARKVVELMPSIEKIRFVSSGTEATMSAVRLARGFTKRNIVVKFIGNYHGHADFFLIQAGSGVVGLTATSSSAGIPDEIISQTVCLPYNEIEVCKQFLLDPKNSESIAAIIIEPIAGNMGCVPAKKEFLKMLREVTQCIGAVLIFDEVISGFRVGLGGAQEMYGIAPDMTCLGKIIGGGFPAAAFGGRHEIMDCLAPLGTVYQAGTLSGNPVAMATGLQALNMLEIDGFYDELERKANIITEPLRELFNQKKVSNCVQQVGSMFTIFFGRTSVANMEEGGMLNLENFANFFRYMFANGVYIPPAQYEAWFVSSAHTEEHLEMTRDLILNYFEFTR